MLRSIIPLGLALPIALGLALILAIFWLNPPGDDLGSLMASLLLSGLLSVGLGAISMFWLWRGRMRIWQQVILTYLFGVAVTLGNIVLTARLMFISSHDLPLLALLILFAGVIAIGLGSALSRVFTQRIMALHQSAEMLAQGNLTARVPLQGNDELARLAQAFNHMADQLARNADERRHQEAARRDLIAAISHDLRTPLAAMRVLTDALAEGVVEDPATTARYLGTMQTQIEQLSRLINDLFELSRLDARVLPLDMQRVLPGDLASDAVAGLAPQAAARGVHLDVQIAADLQPILVAPQQIARVLDNLLTNALRHTPAGGAIHVTVTADPSSSQVVFEVADTGEGIAPSDLPHVFERFYRGEKSRSRATGGTGLGLAIARGIVEAHGGTIEIESMLERGTRVRFRVPYGTDG